MNKYYGVNLKLDIRRYKKLAPMRLTIDHRKLTGSSFQRIIDFLNDYSVYYKFDDNIFIRCEKTQYDYIKGLIDEE